MIAEMHTRSIFLYLYILGEANMMLLYGDKNIGKTLTQHIIHFGQGAESILPELILSGGNTISSGTSS